AVALYLADQWWSIDDIVRTSVPARQGLHQVKTVGERIVLYVMNRFIYRTQEMEEDDIPFLCHSSSHYAKILWKTGEAIGFYSVIPAGSVCRGFSNQNYKMTVLDTIFVRKKHRGKDFGLMILEDYVDSFTEEALGLRYPLSSFLYTACKQYLEKYPGDRNLLWQVEGAGDWFQRQPIMSIVQQEARIIAADAFNENKNFQTEANFCQPALPEASGQRTDGETQVNVGTHFITGTCSIYKQFCNDPSVPLWTRTSTLKRPKINKRKHERGPENPWGDKGNALHVAKRMHLSCIAECSEEAAEVPPEVDTAEKDEEMIAEDEGQSAVQTEQHVSPPEKQEPLNGEVTEETAKTSLMGEEETANEVLSGESKFQSESQGKEPSAVSVPLILEPPEKPSQDTVSEKVLNTNDSEVHTEEGTSVEKEGTEEQQEPEETTTENAAASASKEESFDSDLLNSVLTEASEESVSENCTTTLEYKNEEAGHNSQEAPVALNQSSLIVVELEGVSFQQPSGQEGQKNQLEDSLEESAEQTDQYVQAVAERAADSSSEEAEIEVPVVDRRNLRRKTKGYKSPPKKKGKPA
ncbi:Soluble lamin-associated protein of 75 kDa, partial [Acanthisitta chloris]